MTPTTIHRILPLPYAETAPKDSSHQAHPVVRSLPPLVFAPPAVRILPLPPSETAPNGSAHQGSSVRPSVPASCVRTAPPFVVSSPFHTLKSAAGTSRPCYLFVLAPLCEYRPRFVAFRPSHSSRIPKPCNRAGKSALQRIHKRSDGRRAQLLKNVHKFNYEL